MSLVRQQSSSGTQSTFASTVSSTAFGSPLSNPSLIVVSFVADLNTTSANTPTDTAGNTYVRATQFQDAAFTGSDIEVWYAKNTHTTASNVVTVTDNGGGVNSAVVVEEWTGADTTAPFDKTAQASGSGTAIDSGATATLSQANEMVMVTAVAILNANQLSLATGFTNLTQTHTTTPENLGIASKVVSATTAVNGLMTTGSASWAGIVTTWKQAAGGNLTFSVSDTTVVTENLPYIPDVIVMVESSTVELINEPSVSDTTNVTELVTIEKFSYISVSDTTAINELVTLQIVSYINVSDTTAVTELVNINLVSTINVSDTTSITEAVSIEIIDLVSVSDTTAITELVTIRITSFISVSDTTNITELVSLEEFSFNVKSETTVVSDDLGSSIAFNGTLSDFVTIGNSYTIPTGAFTIETWYNSTTWTANARAMDYQDSGPSGGVTLIQIGTTGVLQAAIRNGATATANLNSPVLTDGTWYHILLSFDGSVSILYVNGVQSAQDITTVMSAPTQTVKLGRRSDSVSNFFTGSLAGFRVYGRSLSSTEASQHHNGIFIDETSLQVWYKFTGGIATDLSGNGNTGTINGTTQTGFIVNPYVVIELISLINVSDTTIITELSTINVLVAISVSDTTVVTESVTMEIISFVSKSDTTAITELVNNEIISFINVNDITAVSESVTVVIVSSGDSVSVSDTTNITENVTIFIPVLTLSVSDTTNVTDATTEFIPIFTIQVSDTTAMAESITMEEFEQGVVVSDTTVMSESVTIFIPVLKIFVSDTTTIIELITLSAQSYISVLDTTVVSESVTILIAQLVVSVLDTTVVSEAENIEVIDQGVNVSDTTVMSENVSLFVSILLFVSDTTVVTESVQIFSQQVAYLLNVTDTVPMSEFVKLGTRFPVIAFKGNLYLGWKFSYYILRRNTKATVYLGWSMQGYTLKTDEKLTQ